MRRNAGNFDWQIERHWVCYCMLLVLSLFSLVLSSYLSGHCCVLSVSVRRYHRRDIEAEELTLPHPAIHLMSLHRQQSPAMSVSARNFMHYMLHTRCDAHLTCV